MSPERRPIVLCADDYGPPAPCRPSDEGQQVELFRPAGPVGLSVVLPVYNESAPERRPIVLCADDYGLGDGVNRAILRLARAGRLSAETGS
jgi:hypothetical protein